MVERTRFLRHAGVAPHVTETGECRLGRTGERDDFPGKSLDGGNEVNEFLGFSGLAERQHHVAEDIRLGRRLALVGVGP